MKTKAFSLALISAGLILAGGAPLTSRAASARSRSEVRTLVQRVVNFENKHNFIHEGSVKPVRLESYLIPMDLLEWAQLDRFPKAISDELFITDLSGRKFYRWILHPDDTLYRTQVENDIRRYFDLPPEAKLIKEKHFIGYRTASRSTIVINPKTNFAFSMKTSTNFAGGNWKDKVQPVRFAVGSMLASEHLLEVQKIYGAFEYALPLYESGAIYYRGIDQAQLFRELGDMNEGKTLLMPGFAVFSSEVMEQLKAANNMTTSEVMEHIGFIWGRAQAEFTLKSGLSISSAHFQNFVFEFTPDMKFTGRVGFRDYSDSHLMADFVVGPMRDRMIEHWNSLQDENNMVFKRSLSVSFMPYYGLEQVIEDPILLNIHKATRKGFESYLKSTMGPWVYSQWRYTESHMDDGVGLLVNLKPINGFNIPEMLQTLSLKKAVDCNLLLAQ